MIVGVQHLDVYYGQQHVLDDVTFDVEAGDYVGIVGPNGSGKTTLVKALLGLVAASGGQITLSDAAAAAIGYLPQRNPSQDLVFPGTVREIVATGLLNRKRHPRFFHKGDTVSIDLVLERLKITELQHKKIGSLSGGQYQRALLARAMVNDPALLILDEPASALDPAIREDFYTLLTGLNDSGVTILLVSHDVSTIGKYTSKMLYLDRSLIFYGSYEDFCKSEAMTEQFGHIAQHQMCWRHDGACPH